MCDIETRDIPGPVYRDYTREESDLIYQRWLSGYRWTDEEIEESRRRRIIRNG